MEDQPPSEGTPENKIPGVGGDASVVGGDASGLRIVAAEKLDESAASSQLVVRLVPEKAQRPQAPRTLGDVRTPSMSAGAAEVSPEVAEPPRQREDPEPEWGAQTPAPASRLWLTLGMATLALAVVGGTLILLRSEDSAAPRTPVGKTTQVIEDRLQWYRENPDQAERQTDALLEGFTRATKVEEVLALVREPERVEPLLRERWQPLGSPLNAAQPSLERGFSAVGGVAFYFITAELEDFRKLRIYFVRENGRMKIDWEASVAHSSVAVEKLQNTQGLRDVKLRCSIEAQTISLPLYPASEYNGYLLALPGNQEPLWGLARIGSEVDEALLDALDRGRFLLDLKTSERVTVEVDEAPDAPPNYFIISKLNHVEWVSP